MTNEPIYVDAARAAVLEHGTTSVNCHTLQEAMIAFNRLPAERQEIAKIVSVGRTYGVQEIRRFRKM